MKILGIETSCDETAAAVVENGTRILSNVVFSQINLHKTFGGVVPEIAARSHLESVNAIVNEAVAKAGGWEEVDAIAVTSEPGLIGALMIGTLAARSYALTLKKPLISVHHIKGHIYANFLERDLSEIKFPILALVVSGGHTQIVLLKSHTNFTILGSTRDDAVGEVFDKVARVLGLPYPGGPEISRLAASYSGEILPLPVAKLKPLPEKPFSGELDFSFSGLKTAVLRAAQKLAGAAIDFPSFGLADKLTHEQKAMLASSFEQTVIKTLVQNMLRANEKTGGSETKNANTNINAKTIMLAGGVAANRALRNALIKAFPNQKVIIADPNFCTDNAAMIASAGFFQIQNQQTKTQSQSVYSDPKNFSILPRSIIR